MKILVTGANGLLGSEVVCELLRRGDDVIATGTAPMYRSSDYIINKLYFDPSTPGDGLFGDMDYRQLDITDETAVRALLLSERPNAVIHCASWTAVDDGELPENHDSVTQINVRGTESVAKYCKAVGSKLMYISTEYVFDDSRSDAWDAEDSLYNKELKALNHYGQTKLDGERIALEMLDRCFVVRTSWSFGKNGNNFLKIMQEVGRNNKRVRVVDDQTGRPTYAPDLAALISDMIRSEKYGVYNVTNEGDFVSRYELVKKMYEMMGLETEVIPVSTEEYGSIIAKRPQNSRLSTDKLEECGFSRLPDWEDAVRRFLNTDFIGCDHDHHGHDHN